MLDHMTFRVTDIAKTKAFYSAALTPLGYSLSFEGNYGMNILGYSYPDPTEPDGKKADVWFVDGPSPYGGPAATSGCHLAWKAKDRAQVDAFYAAAIAAGAKDNGAPGLRPHYHPNYYGAFVIDPEGNNIEAVYHGPAMNEHEKLNYVEYPSADLPLTKAFFENAFGWSFVDYGPDYTAFSGQGLDGGFYRAEMRSSTANGAALLVFYSKALEETLDKVIKAGGIIVKPIFSFPGGRRFHFTEPSGNEFAVWSGV